MTGAGDQGYIPGTGRPYQVNKFIQIFLIAFGVKLNVNKYGLFAAFRTLKHLQD